MAERRPLPPGSTIGILGGGQLGRMLAIAAARLGLRVHVYDPGAAPPAAEVCHAHTRAAFDDAAALGGFAAAVDVVTFEFENVPAATAAALAGKAPVHPPERALAVSQDRATEKGFMAELGIATAPWQAVDSLEDLRAAIARIGTPAVLKTRRLGYDGKGQARISAPEEAAGAWAAIGESPAVLEGFVAFDAEISVIAARGADGAIAAYDPGMNLHDGGILRRTTVPAPVPRGVAQEAVLTTGRILNALDYVGVIGVEFFVAGRQLLVNEFAPRVHNSGHWTIEACVIDQFAQHIRAVAGWPLGDGSRHSDAVMENLIGDEADRWEALAGDGCGLHLYGKAETRPGRKMGHLTRISPKS
ncbi:5-(carboxyamino)imidazole ribonucleotide synthase [Paralimibaculum aggregatum]|uniref:N5-carboxyaminoimidazole ribonucleotide synthase n=1 Tax=Paralimibaculum aggregatum TaxID=3036245 RepID=A0ABQ6LI39_9RHOB|nr:5-(carboxyamino)imidazole ribonucleotide synthase [Limibaculum sp. NKW23]GMG82954.1 5-(carboxyamino)imidazole ribonucleotide synthase [Limibaculum sp. NKW23]